MSTTTAICAKCDGLGNIAGFEHVENGVCFACKGTGRVAVSARRARRDAEQQHKTARVAALDAADHDLNVAWSRLGITDSTRFERAKSALFAAATDDEAVAAVREIVSAR